MNRREKADEYAPSSDGPSSLAIRKTSRNELIGVETWVSNDARVFLATLLMMFTRSLVSSAIAKLY